MEVEKRHMLKNVESKSNNSHQTQDNRNDRMAINFIVRPFSKYQILHWKNSESFTNWREELKLRKKQPPSIGHFNSFKVPRYGFSNDHYPQMQPLSSSSSPHCSAKILSISLGRHGTVSAPS